MEAILGAAEAFDGGDGAAIDGAEEGEARVDAELFDLLRHHIIFGEEDEAGTAATFPAAKLGAGESGVRSDVGEEGHGRIGRGELHSAPIEGEDEVARRGGH